MDIEFDPERCAELHNALLARTYESTLHATRFFERNMISRINHEIPSVVPWLFQVSEEAPNPLDLPIHRFFSNINTYHPPGHSYSDSPLSGGLKQPEPRRFYHSFPKDSNQERRIILLYPGNVQKEAENGGLFLDLDTYMAIWARLEWEQDIPHDSRAWLPLQLALELNLVLWDRGKYYWNGGHLDIRSWTQRDLGDALHAWETLIQAIHNRLPAESSAAVAWKDPLPAALLDESQISPFAQAFLQNAKRPPFTHVAPGLTTFDEQSYGALMRAETPTASFRFRMSWLGLDPDQGPSLILPAAVSVPSIPQSPPPPGDEDFDRPWGHGRYTIGRKAGLYTGFSSTHGDNAILITAEGRAGDQPIKFAFPRPWGNDQLLTFADMFGLWTWYVNEELWEVDGDGVSTPHSWFTRDDTEEHRKVYWG
ncbi:hypothetical protein B0I35DRAFT_474047 [Stachybotrys elegans]|uniref:Uncharacterized protein n=1 Tax=Stachybotrys elegans TaxID=80388 RepID=A0A8K0WX81_9HYPO|nr:hypothetical protein B0I35DRAFT_474047 [Stachybotrys elegans]